MHFCVHFVLQNVQQRISKAIAFVFFSLLENRAMERFAGLTPVVHALNDENSLLETGIIFPVFCGLANALNSPPEESGRKVKTQRNRRGLTQVVEHVV